MAKKTSNPLLPCLVYHRLHRGAGPEDPYLRAFSIEAERFREQMEGLCKAGFVAGSLTDFSAWQEGKCPPPEKPLLLTFDDGWASNFTLAWPELRRLGMACTIFVVADRQAEIFGEGADLDRPLRDEEMLVLAAEGACIQSHGLTHRPLTELSDEDLSREIVESRHRLERLLKEPIEWLAAPYGLSDKRVEHFVRRAGYRGFVPGLIGANRLARGLPMSLRRLGVRPCWSSEELISKVSSWSLFRAALAGNLKRRLRIALGHKWSSRLRGIIRGRPAC